MIHFKDKRKENEVHKKKLSFLYPILFFCAFFIIIAVTLLSVALKNPSKKNGFNLAAQTEAGEKSLEGERQILAVLTEINSVDKTMTLLDTLSGQEVSLTYTGGTNVLDKYDQVISTSQLIVGDMIDAYFLADTEKLVKLQISKLAWEYKGANNWSINTTERVFNIVDSKYKYTQKLVCLRQGKPMDMLDLDEKDELTIRGYERQIWSILVTKGHGSIQFTEYDDFIGGTAYIGNEDILPVVSDMTITVQEGSYDVTLEKGDLKGTKQISVGADEEVILNMGEFKKPAIQTGLVSFYITPEGADLYIDELLQSYEDKVELEYGEHIIKVSLGGYTAYSGNLEVDETSKTISIDLVETPNLEESTTDEQDQNQQEDYGGTIKDGTTGSVKDDLEKEDDSKQEDSTDKEQKDSDQYIYIQKPEGASVYFTGVFKGTVPVSFPKEVGTHYITLIKDGYATKTYTVEVPDDGKDTNLNFADMVEMQ